MNTTLFLADDHPMMRDGLRALLAQRPEFEVLGEAGDGRAALAAIKELHPDVAVLDIAMPQLNGIDATRQIVQVAPNTRVIILSYHTDKRYVLAALRAGARAYVVKEAASSELFAALEAVSHGQVFLSPMVTEDVLNQAGDEDDDGMPLSDREREILQLLAEGHTSPQIARMLHLAPTTVETHRRNILRKLRLKNVVELTRYAVRHGLTTP